VGAVVVPDPVKVILQGPKVLKVLTTVVPDVLDR
jgi:hypothetical protein